MTTEALSKAAHDAGFLVDDLIQANRGAPALESLLLLELISKARDLNDRIAAVLAAKEGRI